MDLHELVAKVKEFRAQEGRAPTRGELEAAIPGLRHSLSYIQGGFTAVLHAAGLPSYQERRRRGEGSGALTNAIFERPIEDVLDERKPPLSIKEVPLPIALFIPDVHFPWANQRVLDAAYRWASDHKPALILQGGDIYDMFSHSKFPRSQNIYMPQDEERIAREMAEKMWKELQAAAPKAECVQLKGNHDIRPLRRTLESLPSIEHVVSKHLDVLMSFPGVKLIADHREEFYINENTIAIHGWASKLGAHRDYSLLNVIRFHDHVGGCIYKMIRGRPLFEMSCGLAGDPEAKCFGYTPQRIKLWTPGFSASDGYGPRFIPV